jgi:hypothetical protein
MHALNKAAHHTHHARDAHHAHDAAPSYAASDTAGTAETVPSPSATAFDLSNELGLEWGGDFESEVGFWELYHHCRDLSTMECAGGYRGCTEWASVQ